MSEIAAPAGFALRELLAGLVPEEVVNVELSPLAGGFSGAMLSRVRVTLAGGGTRAFVLKRARALEREVHRLLDRELPGTAAALLGSCRAPGSEAVEDGWLLLMPDLAADGGDAAARPLRRWGVALGGREALGQGLGKLAGVHGRFTGRAADLRAIGLAFAPPSWLTESASAPAVAGALRVCAGLLDLPIERQTLDAVDAVSRALPERLAALDAPDDLTLVHGDFHQGNVVSLRDGSVRVLDWGAAALQVPAWDLVTQCEAEIRSYLAIRAAGGCPVREEGRFHRELRAATICRMLAFIQAGLRTILGGDGPAGVEEGVLRCLPMCAARLVTAASDSAFRGGHAPFGAGVDEGSTAAGAPERRSPGGAP